MGKVIIIASGKGGTGKTTATANIGAALALNHKSVVVVDMDMGLRNLDVALGLESNIVYDVTDAISDAVTIDDALIKIPEYDSFYFIPSSQTKDASSINYEDEVQRWQSLWKTLSDRFDYCLIDAPAGIDGGFKYGLYGADKAIVVTLAETAALRDADRVINILEDNEIEDIRLVMNRIRPEMIEKGIMMDIDRCIEMLGIPILGIVGDDIELTVSSLKGELSVNNENSIAGCAFKNIAARILGGNVPIMDFDNEHRTGIIAKLKSLFFRRKG